MKILFIGLGSIGQRHLVNAKKIFKGAKFFALRKTSSKNIIKETKLIKKMSLKKYYNIIELKNYKSALKLKPNLTFVCNPSARHLIDSYNFAKNGSDLFIEKPLGNSNFLYKKLLKEIKKKKLISMIGYQMRFNPIIRYIEKILKDKTYGKVFSADFKNLSYLPKYHTYENYKNSYVAKKKLGGGALASQIHEIDLITNFFGFPEKTFNSRINSKLIDIEAEEEFSSLMIFKDKNHKFNLSLRISLSNFLEERCFKIFLEKATISADLIKNRIEIKLNNKNKLIKKKFNFNRNDLFNEELKLLKKSIIHRRNNFLSLANNYLTQKLYFKLLKES